MARAADGSERDSGTSSALGTSEDEGESPRPSVQAQLGLVIAGTYRLVRHIGSGGMSDVFAAEHVRLGKMFAVKLLRAELGAERRAAQRLRREARAIAALSSEHVVSVLDCGQTEQAVPFLVMELLEGEDLRSLLRRSGTLSVPRAVNIVLEAARGLERVHEQGLVHRDLKPENLFITRRASGEDWCKVLDFGVAKMESSLSTAQGVILGTIRYMAPEQLADSASVSPATDVYALGAILYECLSGRPPHEGEAIQELMFQILNQPPPALLKLRPELPDGLVDVIGRCLHKQPEQRPSLQELETTLRASAHRRLTAAADSTLADEPARAPLPKATPARRIWPALAAATLVGAALGYVTGTARAPSASPASTPAPAGNGALERDVSRSVTFDRTPLAGASPATQPTVGLSPAPVASAVTPRTTPPRPERTPPSTKPTLTPVKKPAASASRSESAQPSRPGVGKFDESNPYHE